MSDLARTRTGQKEKGPCKLFVGQFAWPFFFGFSFITTAYRSYSHPWKCRLIVMTANSITWDSRCTIHDARFTVGLSADSVSMLDWAWCHGAGSEGCRHAGVGGILFHARNLMKRPLWEWWRQPRMAAGRGASLPSKTRDGRDGGCWGIAPGRDGTCFCFGFVG